MTSQLQYPMVHLEPTRHHNYSILHARTRTHARTPLIITDNGGNLCYDWKNPISVYRKRNQAEATGNSLRRPPDPVTHSTDSFL